MYKLIAVDMDETLLTQDKKITSNTLSVLNEARSKGIKIVLATGRPFEGIIKYIKQLGTYDDNNYSIVYNGAKIVNNFSRNTIAEQFMNGENLHEIYDLSKKFNTSLISYTISDGCITPEITEYSMLEARINGINIKEMDLHKVKDNEPVIKAILTAKSQVLDSACENMPKYIYDKYCIVRSDPHFLEFLKKNTNKGTGLELLAKKLGIKREEVMSFGDAGNDTNMVRYAGMGVAMGNAFDEVKKAANFVTLTNNEDGVAYAVKKFCNI